MTHTEAANPREVLDRNGLEILHTKECLRLLEAHHVGRVALSVAALPVILPVNYVARGHEIVFRTSPGSKLDAASRHNVVAFEVDSIDPVYHEGWSVLATGRAEEITDPRELAEAAALPLQPWAPWVEHRFVKITAELISGRRLRHFAA